MREKMFHSTLMISLTALVIGGIGVWCRSPLGLFLAAILVVLVSFWNSVRVARLVTEPLETARLEDLEVQKVCRELQPLATRMLEQNRQIQKQLHRRYLELKREYEKQDRMRRDFTANVSHELKTPLTSISGYAEIIRDGMVKREDIAPFAGKIYDEAQRLIALVGDILKLSRLDEGHQLRDQRESIDLYAACQRVIASLEGAAGQRGISFTLTGTHEFIMGVVQIVDEIVFNLCDNAIKYNVAGGRVEVTVGREDNRVALSVADSGIGIPPEDQDRIFERFYRVDKSHSKEIGGTGLGLSIVKHGAAHHDARIELISTLGEGTMFKILFHQGMSDQHGRSTKEEHHVSSGGAGEEGPGEAG
ncbi:MAG: domain S-box [Firmicutes bacterium]|nr:domain S-box [Bacillota bacterium]